MYWCPYLDFEVPDLYSLVLPSPRRIEVVIPTILWLASVGFIVHCLHPSISFQFCFNPTYYLTCGMEDLSPLEPLLEKPTCLYCVLALSWWQNFPFGELDCMPKSFWSVVLMFGIVQNSPWSLEISVANIGAAKKSVGSRKHRFGISRQYISKHRQN